METPVAGSAPDIPIREDLFVEPASSGGGAALLGSRCACCGRVFFPKEQMCPVCIAEGTLEGVRLSGHGTLQSFTFVRRALPGFLSPYALGAIELDEGPSLIAQIEGWQDVDLAIGMRVRLAIGTIKCTKEGARVIGPKFHPLAASAPAGARG